MSEPSSPPRDTLDLFRLDGKVAVVTGAAGLLGEQHATALADAGAHVVLADRKGPICTERAASLTAGTKVECAGFECDVTSPESWNALLAFCTKRFGGVDILVNNAAFTAESRSPNYGAAFEQFPLGDWNQIIAVNLSGSFLGCQIIGRQMVERGNGSIINVASMYGLVSPHHAIYAGTGISQPVAYSVSKAGVLALTRYLGTLWATRGVRVNAITPGGVSGGQSKAFTERYQALSPSGRMAEPFEMRGAILYLASGASSHFTAQNLVVDGGWTAW